jgi:hypothetical protein
MKKVIFLGLIVLLSISTYAQGEKSPIEGTWKMVYGKWVSIGPTYPAQTKGDQIKMFSKKHFMFVGHFEADTLSGDNYGWGTYTLNGNKYEEHEVQHSAKSYMGQTVRLLVEIRNDTLIQKWPANENWKLEKDYSVEKYVRAE